MLLCRRALPTQRCVPWRASTLSHRRWYTPRSSRTVLLHNQAPDGFFLELASSALPRIEADDHPLVVILSSPLHASRFTSSSGPTLLLQDLVSRVLKKSLKHPLGATLRNVQVLSAVVDAFPAPSSGHVADGFAYMVLRSENGKPKSLVTLADEADQHEHGTLEFQLSDNWFRELSSGRTKAIGATDYFVAMKLANTLFQSGRRKTMLDVTYAVDPSGDLYPVRHEWLAHCSIAYDIEVERQFIKSLDERASKTSKQFDVSLVPLTESRKISVSLGNILRTVELPDGSSCPASRELEANLDAYFKATKQIPHARPVWALLMNQAGFERSKIILQNAKFLASLSDEPGQQSSLESIWTGLDKATVGSLRETIYLDGSRLQRVLSGGGGWGDKAGLLALDPQDSLHPHVANDKDISQFSSDMTDFTHVQFFTSTDSTCSQLPEFRRGLWMGTIPDGIPRFHTHSGGRAAVYPDTFGALSTGGMSLRTHTVVHGHRSNTDQVTQTKIDVPFASFTNTLPRLRDAALDASNESRAIDLLRQDGLRTLQNGNKLLRHMTDFIWGTMRDASHHLHSRAGVDLVKRRNEIKPILDCIVRVKHDVSPSSVRKLSSGITRFNQMVDSGAITEVRKTSAEVAKHVRIGDDFIDRIVSQVAKIVQRSNDDAKYRRNFNMAARQKLIEDVYSRLIPIAQTMRPKLVENHMATKQKTLRTIWGYRLHYIHNCSMVTQAFLADARRTIDGAKRKLNVPVTHYEGTLGAQTQSAASSLQDLLGRPTGTSGQNLNEMKRRGAKQSEK